MQWLLISRPERASWVVRGRHSHHPTTSGQARHHERMFRNGVAGLPLVALTNVDFLQVGQPGASPWPGGIITDDPDLLVSVAIRNGLR
jgi:hypothetical protein